MNKINNDLPAIDFTRPLVPYREVFDGISLGCVEYVGLVYSFRKSNTILRIIRVSQDSGEHSPSAFLLVDQFGREIYTSDLVVVNKPPEYVIHEFVVAVDKDEEGKISVRTTNNGKIADAVSTVKIKVYETGEVDFLGSEIFTPKQNWES